MSCWEEQQAGRARQVSCSGSGPVEDGVGERGTLLFSSTLRKPPCFILEQRTISISTGMLADVPDLGPHWKV